MLYAIHIIVSMCVYTHCIARVSGAQCTIDCHPAAPLQVSLLHWNQDEECGGGFGGSHAMVVGGYAQPLQAMAAQLVDLRLATPVQAIEYTEEGVRVTTEAGEVVDGDAVIVTVPLGCLKADTIRFSPPLPGWKLQAINNVGFGNLNKVPMGVVLLFLLQLVNSM